ncbi:uncharacterized protein TrAFT101_003784 [Trichoderma asperellum]|uniref:uncharacterized protein n=1 Tax=Trichoderma asperellum TaxID=101201 RepID=UPI00331FA794|nr:hypothetical protein TrAFT101_003784 [Trichoderma asperellum]
MAGTPVPHPQQALTFTDVFDDDDVDEPKEAQTIHHIRANSSIMHLKKILVANRGEIRKSRQPRHPPVAA